MVDWLPSAGPLRRIRLMNPLRSSQASARTVLRLDMPPKRPMVAIDRQARPWSSAYRSSTRIASTADFGIACIWSMSALGARNQPFCDCDSATATATVGVPYLDAFGLLPGRRL